MRRTLVCLILGVLVTGLLAAGLAWCCVAINVRQWSDDPLIQDRQILLVLTVLGLVFAVYEINRRFNPPRHHSSVVRLKGWETETDIDDQL
ncbi:hypothetical protein V5E97_22710 [Singulisphaera sp. Ch08]|uniref:Uncharacterized protein n=1 Tax=Singulisphaera sp. Ch08 TaxID=3120278 RepID=A0AAU7C7Q5_9BACT